MKTTLYLKHWIILIIIAYSITIQAQTTKTIGSTGANYTTLKAAFDAINSGTLNGVIVLQIVNNTTESAAASLNASGTGSANYTSITIYPTVTGKTISGGLNASLINFNGADNVLIDGRLNMTGSTADLNISNTSTGTSASTISFSNSSENNTVRFCVIKGSGASQGTGVVYFKGSTSGNGNSNNSISNNKITCAGTNKPANGIVSSPGTSVVNRGNTISENEIYNLINPTLGTAYINVYTNSTGFNITSNHMYETAAVTPTVTNKTHYGIYLRGSNQYSFTISNNYIGGSSTYCSGEPLTINTNSTSIGIGLIGIYINSNANYSVQGNLISNIQITTASSSSSGPFYGIYVGTGTVNIGNESGNTIGSATGTGSITVTYRTSSSSYVTSYGIYINNGNSMNVSNNQIGSISLLCTNPSYSDHDFYGLSVLNSSSAMTISNNIVGSLTSANSIQTSVTSNTLGDWMYGIYVTSTGVNTITSNTVKNLYSGYTGTSSGRLIGIYSLGGTNTINNNSVEYLRSESAYSSTSGLVTVNGIYEQSNSNASISGNTVSNLTNTHATAATTVLGIFYTGSVSNRIENNKITELTTSSTNLSSRIIGLFVYRDSSVVANNIVDLGNSETLGKSIFGIYDGGSTSETDSYYFNSSLVRGSIASGLTNSTYAFYGSTSSNTKNLENNIFYNIRSGGTTGKHMAIRVLSSSSKTFNYNDYFANGVNGILGEYGGVNKTTLSAWQTATGQDVHSVVADPGINLVFYGISNALSGTSVSGITVDFYNNIRNSTPMIGAVEFEDGAGYVWTGNTSTNFATASNWQSGIVPPSSANISFSAMANNHCVLDQNRILGSITNASNKNLVLNGYQLQVAGEIDFTNTGQIDAETTHSEIVFNGILAQNYSGNNFTSNTIENLTVDNSLGLIQNDDVSIVNTMRLSQGIYRIGNNTLSFNDSLVIGSGQLVGGVHSEIIVTGSSTALNLPEIDLNSLQINRSNGINLIGQLSIDSLLTLTDGTLNADTFTISFESSILNPIVASGSINASNSELVFNNNSILTIADGLFADTINKLTVNGSGLVFSGDVSINGQLNLNHTNQSATVGLIDMQNHVLSLGVNATIIGSGDVSGIVKRFEFFPNVAYVFGNSFTTITFANEGIAPEEIQCKINIGSAPTWKTDAILRTYDFVRVGGSNCNTTISTHYLDSELNGNEENNLVQFTYGTPGPPLGLQEWGKSSYNTIDNWISISNVDISNFPTAFGALENTQASSLGVDQITWDGSESSSWETANNWTPAVVPNANSNVLVPDSANTPNDPIFSSHVTINSVNIQNDGYLTCSTNQNLTINGGSGAWIINGTFVPTSGTVIFTNANATTTGRTQFNNITIDSGARLTAGDGNVMSISGILSNNGVFCAGLLPNTVNYNGNAQTVAIANGATEGYYHLTLSGSGSKTLPSDTLFVHGNMNMSGTSSTIAQGNLLIFGDCIIESDATFSTGNFNHFLSGNLTNDGTFTTASGYSINFNGTSVQSLDGASSASAHDVIINNPDGVIMNIPGTIYGTLTLEQGILMIGSVDMIFESGSGFVLNNGSILVQPTTNLTFGNGGSIVLPNNLFSEAPSLNHLTLNSTNLTLGQDMIVNGTMTLNSSTFTLGNQDLTLQGNSPVSALGYIDASSATSNLIFNNSTSINLPNNLFSGSVNNMIIFGTGGVISLGDFSISGTLNLSGLFSLEGQVNPSSTIGLLDMGEHTLTMEGSSTNIGPGDVSGIVRRTAFNAGTVYTFGNPFTNITFDAQGTPPTEINCKITLGVAPAWKSDAIHRTYDFIRTGGSNCNTTISTHYLTSELNGNSSSELVQWTEGSPNTEWGKSAYSETNHWVSISNVNIANFPTAFDVMRNTLGNTSGTNLCTWTGASGTDWSDFSNWSPAIVPDTTANIIIPDPIYTYNNSPIFTPSDEVKITSIHIGSNANLTATDDADLVIYGSSNAWINNGNYMANHSNVIFTNSNATISGFTRFYNLTVQAGASLTPGPESYFSIEGILTNNGILHAEMNQNTVEYDGASQNVINPNGLPNGYYHLVLSGSGDKELPISSLPISGNLNILTPITANANNNINIEQNLTIEEAATLNAGTHSHSIGGDVQIDGVYYAEVGNTLILNGSSGNQTVSGSSTLNLQNLTINKTGIANNVYLNNPTNINSTLVLTSGNIINGNTLLTLESTANVSPVGGSENSFVEGLLRKKGNSAFIFPIGSNGVFAPIGISAPSLVTDHFTAEYVNENPDSLYPVMQKQESINHVSRSEYWNLNRTGGSSNIYVTLCWDERSNGVSDASSLVVAKWNNSSLWVDYGQMSYTGDTNSGTITSNLVSDFSPFTLASKDINNTLPVSLVYFVSTCDKGYPVFTWSTSSENNVDYFELEGSNDLKSWNSVSQIKAKGFSNALVTYNAKLDRQTEYSYHRLHTVDFDGKYSYSNYIFQEKCEDFIVKLDIYPNPAKDEIVVNLNDYKGALTVCIKDITGKVYLSKDFLYISPIRLNLSTFQSGYYLVQFTYDNQALCKELVVE